MFGPRIVGENGIELRPPTREDYDFFAAASLGPEVTRFWGPRLITEGPTEREERMKKDGDSPTAYLWSIAYQGDTVGFTGVFGIDWARRDGETGIFIGRADLYGRGIASEAVRLRMAYIWNELGLRRTHNWIALENPGSWKANKKMGYAQVGTLPRAGFRSGEWVNEWLGEAFPHTYPADKLPSPWKDAQKERAGKE